MSTKRGKKNDPTVAPEEDFEAFVRESLVRLCEGQDKIIQDISNLKAKVQLNEAALGKISTQFTTLNQRINIRKFCPTVIGCYYWNDIPLSIRNKPTRKLFKKALYQYYFAQY